LRERRASEIVNPTIDSLERLVKITKEDSSKQDIYYKLGGEFQYSEPEKALNYYKKALIMAKKIKDRKGIAGCLNRIGVILQAQGKYQKALSYYKRSLGVCKDWLSSLPFEQSQGSAKNGIASSLLNIGEINRALGNYDIAIDYYLQSLKIYEQLKDSPAKILVRSAKLGISLCWNNTGIIYYYQGSYEKALDYFIRSLKIKEILGEKRLIANQMMNIGVVYKKLNKIEKARGYYMRSLSVHKKMGNKQGISACLSNIANIYAIEENLKKSLEYRLQALKIARELDDQHGISQLLSNIGNLYSRQGKYNKAIEYIKRSLSIAEALGVKYHIMIGYEQLADVYATQKKYKPAYQYHQLYAQVKNSLFNEEKAKEIGKLEARNEFEKKITEEKARTEAEAKAEAERQKTSNFLQYSVIVIVIAVLLLTVSTLGWVFTSKKGGGFVLYRRSEGMLPVRVSKFLIFIIFLLLFEFILVLSDSFVEKLSEGAPLIKVLFNVIVATIFFPIHRFFDVKIRSWLFQTPNNLEAGTKKPIKNAVHFLIFFCSFCIINSPCQLNTQLHSLMELIQKP